MDRDLTAIADALGDLEYVVKGTAVSYGIDMEPVFKEVHESNMSKLGRRTDGKVLKGGDFRQPDIRRILEAQTDSVGR
jgi:predicted HAD superfamily Cof-like phosphohydrolase